jgi:hypothetical protein
MNIQLINRISENKHNAFPTSIQFGEYEYLAFRSASTHYPTNGSKILTYRRKINSNKWEKFQEFYDNSYDYRDPSFGIIDNKLCLAFTEIKGNEKSVQFCTLIENIFTKPIRLEEKNICASMFVNLRNETYLVAFKEPAFSKDDVLLLKVSVNGKILISKILEEINGTETDIIEFNKEIIGVTRCQKSKTNTSGSTLFKLDKELNVIQTKYTNIKFDAPELFIENQKLYLLSRSTTFNKGRYNIFKFPFIWNINSILNMLIYWMTPKRLSLFKFNPDLGFTKILDFPTTGDTGYSSYLNGKVVTYSTNSDNKNLPWSIGQNMQTDILEYELKF